MKDFYHDIQVFYVKVGDENSTVYGKVLCRQKVSYFDFLFKATKRVLKGILPITLFFVVRKIRLNSPIHMNVNKKFCLKSLAKRKLFMYNENTT